MLFSELCKEMLSATLQEQQDLLGSVADSNLSQSAVGNDSVGASDDNRFDKRSQSSLKSTMYGNTKQHLLQSRKLSDNDIIVGGTMKNSCLTESFMVRVVMKVRRKESAALAKKILVGLTEDILRSMVSFRLNFYLAACKKGLTEEKTIETSRNAINSVADSSLVDGDKSGIVKQSGKLKKSKKHNPKTVKSSALPNNNNFAEITNTTRTRKVGDEVNTLTSTDTDTGSSGGSRPGLISSGILSCLPPTLSWKEDEGCRAIIDQFLNGNFVPFGEDDQVVSTSINIDAVTSCLELVAATRKDLLHDSLVVAISEDILLLETNALKGLPMSNQSEFLAAAGLSEEEAKAQEHGARVFDMLIEKYGDGLLQVKRSQCKSFIFYLSFSI